MKKLFVGLMCYLLIVANVLADDAKTNNNEKQNQNVFVNFIKNWVFTEENPIFRDKTHMLGVDYSNSFGDHKAPGIGARYLQSMSFQYSRPNGFFGIHGRYTVGIFTLFGDDTVAKYYGNKYSYSAFGVEFLQELIAGNKYIYLSAGIGPAIIVSGNRKTNRNEPFGFSVLNFASRVAIGHRFDCGLVLEFMLKHYSSGGLGDVNNGTTMYAVAMRYVF